MASTNKCIFIDWETKSKRPIEDGAFAYANDESTDILTVSFGINDDTVIAVTMDQKESIKPLIKAIKDGYIMVAHNFLFEIAIFIHVAKTKYGLSMPELKDWRCTAQMSARAGLPLSLDGSSKALNLTHKLASGKALIKLFSLPQSNGEFVSLDSRPKEKAQLLEYNRIDSVICRDIWRNLPEWKDEELSDVLFDLENNLRGVPIDTHTSKIIYDNILLEQSEFAAKATKLTNGIITKMTQVQRLKAWVQKHVSPEIKTCAADSIIQILDGDYGEVDDVSRQLLEMRQHSGKSSTGKYVRFINSTVNDYIYGMIISFGAHTGRSISKLLNLYNLPKPSIKYESMDELVEDLKTQTRDETKEKYGSYLKAASTAIRGMITAPKGKVICVSDYASIEARLVFWLANCKRGLKKYEDGIDLYIDMAAFIYSKPYNSIIKDERWVGKQVILGAGYGLGGQGFVGSCARWGVEVSLDLGQQAIAAYREAYPEIVDLWEDLEYNAKLACKTGKVTFAANKLIAFKTHRTKSGVIMLQMKLPSGRCMTYPSVKMQVVETPWGAKKMSITYKKPKNNGFYRESTYGGKLCENAVQAIARDIFYYGAKHAAKNGYDILFGVYDEVVALAPKEKADIEEFNELICVKPNWAKGLPLEAEGEILNHYQKLD